MGKIGAQNIWKNKQVENNYLKVKIWMMTVETYSGPRLFRPLDTFSSRLIESNSSTYFEAKLRGNSC